MKALGKLFLAGIVWALSAWPTVSAHPLDPALLEIRESQSGQLDVLWRLPAAESRDSPLQPVLPDRCKADSDPLTSRSGTQISARWRASCSAQALVGSSVGVEGLRERQTDALLRIHLADGRLIQRVLKGDEPSFRIPERTTSLEVFRDYLGLGLEHILSGPDHLLFVLGLVLLIVGWKRLLWTITAFTAGHSVTLSLAVLGMVRVPSQPVEALIALTIVAVAVELTRIRPDAQTWMQRFPWVMAFNFGLLHGFGFAGALAQVGLPEHEIPMALCTFNLGIEAGQVLWVAAIVAARLSVNSLTLRLPQASRLASAYFIGSLGAYWLLQRTASLL